MTERDSDHERWLLALNSLQEVSAQYHQMVKIVQSGFSTLGLESLTIRQRLALIEARVSTMDTTVQQLLPHIAEIAAYVVRIQAPPPPRRKAARDNGA